MVEKNILPKGGSDIMLDGLQKNVDLSKYNINIIQSRCMIDYIDQDKINVLWQHIGIDQPFVQGIKDKYFQRSVDAFVYVSHWQMEKYRYIHQIPLRNAYVIKNAINKIEYKKRIKKNKLKIIFTAPADRGLSVMLDAFLMLNRDDVELDVYSSNEIYGSDYVNHIGDKFDYLFNRAKEMKNVNYIGYVSNEEMKKVFQEANIWAYPAIVEETSCLSMIEAGAAGCLMVVNGIGALTETGADFAKYSIIKPDYDELVEAYANFLNEQIDIYWNQSTQDDLKEQSDYYNKHYSWEVRKLEWELLFEKLQQNN